LAAVRRLRRKLPTASGPVNRHIPALPNGHPRLTAQALAA